MNKKGFTLIELLIVIGIIAILASAVIVAINPGQQFAAARDATRNSHINTLYNGFLSYQHDNLGVWETLIPVELTEICNTNLENPECETYNLFDASFLVDQNYISMIPVDPSGGEHQNGTGYFISQGSIILVAVKFETRFTAINITEEEYGQLVEGGGEFVCGDNIDYQGQTYPTMEVGDDCWFAENINYDGHVSGQSWCYDNDPQNCEIYGRLYDWEGALFACTGDWVLPTDNDWNNLKVGLGMSSGETSGTGWIGGNDDIGSRLAGTPDLWLYYPNEPLFESEHFGSSDFNAIPGGVREGENEFYTLGWSARWWTSTEDGADAAWVRWVADYETGVFRSSWNKSNAQSVRCVK